MNHLEASTSSFALAAAVGAATLITATAVLWPGGGLATYAAFSLVLLLPLLLLARMETALLLVLVAVAWFPEFSQTEWDVWSAQDAPSIYNYRPIEAITASVFDYFFALVVALWAWRVVAADPGRILRVPLAQWMLAFLAVCSANLVYGLLRGNEVYYALREFRVTAYFVLVFFMVATTVRGRAGLQRVLRVTFLAAAVVGIYGVLRFAWGIGKEFGEVRLVYYDLADSVLLYMAMLAVLAFALCAQLRQRRGTVFLLLLPMAFSFLFSFRRGAWVGLLFGALFLYLFGPASEHGRRMKMKYLMGATALLLVAVMVAAFLGGPAVAYFVAERALSIGDVEEDSSNVFRIFDALNALNAFRQNPVFGVGLGGRYALEHYSAEAGPLEFSEQVSKTSHNGYLFILFKMGVIGFVVYAGILLAFLRRWFAARKRCHGLALATLTAVGAIFAAMLMNNLTNPISDTLRPAILMAFTMGVGALLFQAAEGAEGRAQGNAAEA